MKANQLHCETPEFDVSVVGVGMGGLCAAISAPRDGARTTISQDQPVFVGNASSEVRLWICGADGAHNKKTRLREKI